MQPSSLIFVVIVAVWAAYLLQHWIRRREVLVTARSVDQFSEAMRVLERPDPSEEHPTAAQASDPLPRTSLRAGSVMTDATPRSSHSAPRSPEPPRQREVGPRPAGGGDPGSARGVAGSPTEQTLAPLEQFGPKVAPVPVRVGSRVIRALASLNSRRVRGLVLLASTVLLICAIVLAPLRMLPWWSPLVSLLLVGGVFAWLRKEAVTEQRARQEQREEQQHAVHVDQEPDAPTGPRLGHTPLPARDTVFDGAQPAPQPHAKPAPEAKPLEGGWSPVPVPRPTYTMKAKAERPVAPSQAHQTVAERHADTPVEELPFDGMALDEDLEELPSAYRVG